jgi:hypothetical protein
MKLSFFSSCSLLLYFTEMKKMSIGQMKWYLWKLIRLQITTCNKRHLLLLIVRISKRASTELRQFDNVLALESFRACHCRKNYVKSRKFERNQIYLRRSSYFTRGHKNNQVLVRFPKSRSLFPTAWPDAT